VFSE
jgi:hypothetical protein